MMTRQLLLFFLNLVTSICVCNYSQAQTCTPIYHKTYNGSGEDEGLDIAVTSDKGSVVAGRTTSNSPGWDGFLMRLNEVGDIVWAKSYGGSDYDELVKVRETSDGGFIALGKTKSFGISAGETWVIKTDGKGILQWSKRFYKNSEPIRPKQIIEISSGGYIVALNTNDSTAQGDGILIRIDGVGNQVWCKVFDNGGDDGINSLCQDGNTLLVGGYGTIADREGILMRVSLVDGTPIWVKKFALTTQRGDEIIQIEKTAQGLAFGATSTFVRSMYQSSSCFLTLFRTVGDDSIYVQRRCDVTTGSGYTTESVQSRTTTDDGFIYLVNDTTNFGWPAFRKISPVGLTDWGRENNVGYGVQRLKGMDLVDSNGYTLTGYYKDLWTGNRSRIQVLRTDITGKTGSCSGTMSSTWTDTTNYIIGSFSWKNITSTVSQETITPNVDPLNYTTNTLCSDSYCVNQDQPESPVCYATLLTHIKGNANYSFIPFDFEKVNNGYIIFGYNRLFRTSEPMMIKVFADGKVQWAKSLTEWIHNGAFDHVLTTSDGNLLLSGHFDVTINHGGWNGAILMKVTPDGKVLWSQDFSGEVYDLKPAENGGFVGTITTSYGFPPIYITLFKMDANGKIVWQKQMNKDYDNSPIYRYMQYDGTYFYVTGEFYNQSPQNIAIEKIDMLGNHIWSKVIKIEGFSTSAANIEIIGDTVYVAAYYWDNSQSMYWSKKRLAIVKISKDGTGMNAFKLSNLDLIADGRNYYFSGMQTQIVTKTLDDNFVVADRVTNVTDSSIVLTKFSPLGQVIWSRRYDQLNNHFISRIKDDNGSLLLLGRKFTGETDFTYQFETVLMRTDDKGIVSQFGTDYCHSGSTSFNSDPARLDEITYYKPYQGFDGSVTSTSFVPLERSFYMYGSPSCATVGDCYNVKLNGPTTICNLQDTVKYTIKRNPGCTIVPVWKYDVAALKVTEQTDSSIAVLFKKGGRTVISATLSSGCGVSKDTILVSVPTPSTLLNLGTDTTICIGTTILLNAHKGYLNYLWQDGSIDSTYRVNQDGKYYVTVTDSCGMISSDTIIILPHPPIPIYIGADRIKCNNDTIHINAPSGFTNYSWSPSYNISSTSTQNIIVNPTKDTSYFVKAEQTPGCFAYDTVQVKVNHSSSIYLGRDTSFCSGKSVVLDAGAGFNQYQWSDASSQQTLSVSRAGTYSVVGTTVDGCSSYDTLKVVSIWSLPTTSLDHNNELCQSSTRILDPGAFSSYLWQDGSTSRKYTVSKTGNYFVKVTDNNGCINWDTVHITTILPSPSNFLPADTSICSYGTADLTSARSFASYIWNNGNTSPKLIVDKAGTYWVQVRDSKGCIGADTILVNIKDCMVGLKVPNAFTPNHDATNDVFRALLFGNVKSFELTVYNRWGQIVFYTTDRYKGWDGTIGGKEQDPGVFIWMCKYELEGDQQKVERGTVTLIR
jgi:gliding motility-associated-like protein